MNLHFKTAGMSFDDHACVRAFKDRYGGGYNNQDLQVDSESVEVLRRLIVQNSTHLNHVLGLKCS